MHPELEWPEIIAATVAALEDRGREAPFEVHLDLIDSRKSDFDVAWQKRLHRLEKRATSGFYLCVIEFETLTGRLLFRA